MNCVGGTGLGFNYGMSFGAPLTMVHGALNFTNCRGTGSNKNYGVLLASAVSAPAIIARDCFGGQGTSSDEGFRIAAALGSAATNAISITAGSLGTGSNEIGIDVNSTIQVGDAGIISRMGLAAEFIMESAATIGEYC